MQQQQEPLKLEEPVRTASESLLERLPAPAMEVAPTTSTESVPEIIIENRRTWLWDDIKEIWRFRELLYFLTWRDIKVRYKQTILGAAWAVLQPIATMGVFAIFLGRVAGIATTDIPYPLFVFAGTLPWTFFSNATNSSSQSVVASQRLVTKVYFPRQLVPVSAIGTGILDFSIGMCLFVIFMLCLGFVPAWTSVFVPVFLLLMILTIVGIGSTLSALMVSYRDFRHIIPFSMQLWMFATPCIYLQPEVVFRDSPILLAVLPFNPAYGLIYNFRQAMLGGPFDYYSLTISAVVGITLFFFGWSYFRRVERHFADII